MTALCKGKVHQLLLILTQWLAFLVVGDKVLWSAHSLDRRPPLAQPRDPIHGGATPGDHINGGYKRRGQFAIIFAFVPLPLWLTHCYVWILKAKTNFSASRVRNSYIICSRYFCWLLNRYLDNPSLTQSFYHGASHREVTKCSLCQQPSVFFATLTKPTFLSRCLKTVMKKKQKTIARRRNRKQVELCLKGTPVMVKRKSVLWQKN